MTITQTDPQQIEDFVEAMWLEKGLSENTLSAYRSDLTKFAVFLALHGEQDKPVQLLDFTQDILQQRRQNILKIARQPQSLVLMQCSSYLRLTVR